MKPRSTSSALVLFTRLRSRCHNHLQGTAAAVLVALVASCASTPAQPTPAPAVPPEAVVPTTAVSATEPVLPLDPAVAAGRLDNGLAYYVRQHGKPENRVTLRLVVNAGSVLETEDQRGLAHYVEHMAFNGTRKFKKQEIVDYLEKVGVKFGQHTNAYTGFDETVYMLQVPADDPEILDRGFEILREFASEISFDPDEVDKERGVVIEEWRLGRGADARIMDQQLPIIFKGSRYAERLPIGKKEILQRASAADLEAFYRAWYRPDLMAVVAVGDVDQAQMQTLIKKHFGTMTAPENPPARPLFPVPDHDETLVAIATDKEMPSTLVGIVHKLPHRPLRTAGDYRRMVVERLYHQMVNARLQELTRRADAPFFMGMSTTQPFVRTRDVFIQFAVVKQDGVTPGLQSLVREIQRVDRHGFLPSELDRAKRELMRHFEAAVTEQDKVPAASYANEMVRHYLVDEAAPGISHEKRLNDEFLPTISLDELNRLAQQWISERNRVLVVSAPADTPVPTRDQAVALLKAIDHEDLSPYNDKVRNGPLVEVKGDPAPPVTERSIEELDAWEWILPNGIRVILKPTDFKNDEVLMTAFSPGGHSLVSNHQFTTAEVADAIIAAGGLGDFDPDELEKTLAGKLASVSPYIGELEEGLDGRASPQDLDTLFQLTYLTLTAPRADPEVFAAWKAQQRDAIVNRRADPGAAFDDRFLLELYRNHPRRQPPSLERLEQVGLGTALAVYQDRFARLGDMTFVFIGNFTLDQMKPLVAQYLGTLPAGPNTKAARIRQAMNRPLEKWRDVGARPPTRVQTFTVEQGVEPKSQVILSWNGDARWTREGAHVVQSLTEALAIRLREVLREDLGGTYGVRVWGGLYDRPRPVYRIDVRFGCAPENVDKLTQAVFAEIEAIKKTGFSNDHLTKVKNTQLRSHEEAIKHNEYWRHALAQSYRQDRDPREALTVPALIKALNGPALQTAAQKYLNTRQYVRGVLKPESAPHANRDATHDQ